MIKKYIKTTFIVLCCATILTTSNACIEKAKAQPAVVQTQTTTVTKNENGISSLTIVNNPKAFLNKTVKINAKFDKFSTLGLDYKSAYKSSEDYISFLIKRDDTTYDIPLSEMKLFLKRDMAEKFIDLKSGDEILIDGLVFSDALGDPWIDVSNITITKKIESKN